AILQILSQSGALGLSGKEIRSKLEISRQLLSHHLRVLNSNGFIEKVGSSRKGPWKISHDGVQALRFDV
ncbi:MAG: winged helix-turn-helix domain-containing protein, partial [Candidatus Poseidoniaceae archaeon]